MNPVYGCVLLQKPLLKPIRKIKWGNNRINNFVKDETILCPGYEVIQICFCKIFLQWVLHKVVFYCRNLFKITFKQIKLVSYIINNFFKEKTILCPGYEVIQHCFCNVYFEWLLHMVVFYCINLFLNLIQKVKWVTNRKYNLTIGKLA